MNIQAMNYASAASSAEPIPIWPFHSSPLATLQPPTRSRGVVPHEKSPVTGTPFKRSWPAWISKNPWLQDCYTPDWLPEIRSPHDLYLYPMVASIPCQARHCVRAGQIAKESQPSAHYRSCLLQALPCPALPGCRLLTLRKG